MAKNYYLVSPHSVLSVFPGTEPCDCHYEMPYEPPLYNVKTSTGTSYYGGSGPIIKEIEIECTACGKIRTSNVEAYDVYENYFNPY